MKTLKLTFFVFLILLISSCAAINRPIDFDSVIDKKSIKKIEGTYKNLAIDSNIPFWESFSSVDSVDIISHRKIYDSTSVFTVKIENDSDIKFEFYVDDRLRFSETFKYRYYKNGVAILGKSNYKLEGIPPIFYRYTNQALWLSKDNNEELFLSYNGSAFGGILIITFGTPIVGESRFKKLQNAKEK